MCNVHMSMFFMWKKKVKKFYYFMIWGWPFLDKEFFMNDQRVQACCDKGVWHDGQGTFILLSLSNLKKEVLLGMSTMQMKFTMKKFKPLNMLVDCRGKLSLFGERNMKDPKVYKIQMGCLKYLYNIMDYYISFLF